MKTMMRVGALLCVSILGWQMRAAQQAITVTPQSLAGWIVEGTDPQALAALPQLSLPGGAQIIRAFDGTDLGLQITTRPVIGQNAQDWPVLEIGTTALLFARNGSTGKLMLALGDSTPVELPFSFQLDADGRSVDPLTVGLTRKNAVLSIENSGQTLQFPAGSATDTAVEIVASAGATQSWTIDRLTVTVGASDPSATPAGGGTSSAGPKNNANGPDSAGTINSGASQAGTVITGSASATGSANLQTTTAAASVSSTKSSLEIFTPPAVRHGHINAIRAAGSTLQKP